MAGGRQRQAPSGGRFGRQPWPPATTITTLAGAPSLSESDDVSPPEPLRDDDPEQPRHHPQRHRRGGADSSRRNGMEPLGTTHRQHRHPPHRAGAAHLRTGGPGGQAHLEPDLIEWNYGAYEGLTNTEIQGRQPGWIVFRDGCPEGESPAQVGERVDRVILRLQQSGGRVALFAHGHWLRVFVARWIGLPPSHGAHFLLDTATLTILCNYRGLPAVKCWNAALNPVA